VRSLIKVDGLICIKMFMKFKKKVFKFQYKKTRAIKAVTVSYVTKSLVNFVFKIKLIL
jgi:hypothetical protein